MLKKEEIDEFSILRHIKKRKEASEQRSTYKYKKSLSREHPH